MILTHFLAISRKELYHIVRDPGTLLLVTIGPVFLMVVFTYTLTSEVRNAPVAVIDQAKNTASRDLIEQMDTSEVIAITDRLDTPGEANDLFDRNQIVAAVIIPEDYGTIKADGTMSPVDGIIDGTEPVSAQAVIDEISYIAQADAEKIYVEALGEDATNFVRPPITIDEEVLYNPELDNLFDFYPGLVGMMLGLPAIALAMAVAREAEHGKLEQLVATPIKKRALLLGKMAPYVGFGMLDVYLLLVMGRLAYDVPFEGSILAYTLVAILFLVANLGLGLLIAVFIRSQQVAMLVAILVFFIPPFFMSGIFFPIDAMPWIVREEMNAFPATSFVAISRPLFLQGTGLQHLWESTAILALLAIGYLELAVFAFRKKVIIDLPNPFHRVEKAETDAVSQRSVEGAAQ
ncbi:MAG: ABC transporter permease [Chloroflexi bacterium]|nr:ABC transporter permease [Chloroflexota bacterium]